MNYGCLSPIQYCRETANKCRKSPITQQMMAELLKNEKDESISVRMYGAYETGASPTPDYIMTQAMEICDCDYAGYLHASQNPVAGKFLPEIEIMTVSQATLRLISAAARYIAIQTDMVNMASDGYIDDTEREKWDKTILPILNDLKKATIELQFAVPDGEKR